MKILLILLFLLSGCATNGFNRDIHTMNKTDLFLTLLNRTSSNVADDSTKYNSPVSYDEWFFLSEDNGVKYYISRKDIDIDYDERIISYQTLYDTRGFKNKIMGEFGYNRKFDDTMQSLIMYRGRIDCKTKNSVIVESNNKMDVMRFKGNIIFRNSIVDSMCNTIDMINM